MFELTVVTLRYFKVNHTLRDSTVNHGLLHFKVNQGLSDSTVNHSLRYFTVGHCLCLRKEAVWTKE